MAPNKDLDVDIWRYFLTSSQEGTLQLSELFAFEIALVEDID